MIAEELPPGYSPRTFSWDDHLRLLALIAELFSDHAFRARLDAAPDATAAAEVFRSGVARVGASPA